MGYRCLEVYRLQESEFWTDNIAYHCIPDITWTIEVVLEWVSVASCKPSPFKRRKKLRIWFHCLAKSLCRPAPQNWHVASGRPSAVGNPAPAKSFVKRLCKQWSSTPMTTHRVDCFWRWRLIQDIQDMNITIFSTNRHHSPFGVPHMLWFQGRSEALHYVFKQ